MISAEVKLKGLVKISLFLYKGMLGGLRTWDLLNCKTMDLAAENFQSDKITQGIVIDIH